MLMLIITLGLLTSLTACGERDNTDDTVGSDVKEVKIRYNKVQSNSTIINIVEMTTEFKPGRDEVTLQILGKKGFEFLGWYYDADYTKKVTLPLEIPEGAEVIDIYAKWFEYSLLEYKNLKNASISNATSYTEYFTPGEDTIVVPLLSREGYDFLGWYTDEALTNQITEDRIKMSESSATFYAKWSPKKVAINWMLDGITAADDNYTKTFYYGDTVTLPTLTKDGMEFMGWYLDENYKTPITEKNIKTTNTDITVYPLFAPIVSFTIGGTPLEQFSIVISADADLDTEYNALQMQSFFKKRTGKTLPIIKDTSAPAAHEIILGRTTRAASATLALDAYQISIKNGSLVIDAGHYMGVNEALKAFLSVYGNPMTDVSIPANYVLSGTTEVPLTWTDDGSAKQLILDKYTEEYINQNHADEKDIANAAIEAIKNFNLNNYELVWNDEFDDLWGSGDINQNKWDMTSSSISGVKHQVDYSTLRVENGELSLFVDVISDTSRENPVNGYSYKMAKTLTTDTMNFRYGYLEMRAEVPFLGSGEVPSFWGASCYARLAHPNYTYMYQHGMEVDIFEQFSTDKTLTPSLHKWHSGTHYQFQGNLAATGATATGSENDRTFTFSSQTEAQKMHTYGFLWTEEIMAFSVDGVFYYAMGLADFFDFDGNENDDMSAYREQGLNVILYNLIFREAHFGKDPHAWGYNFSKRLNYDMFPYAYNIDYMRLYQMDDYGDLWLKGKSDIRLELNGGSLSSDFDGKINNGDTVALPTPTRSGYTFSGWYTSSSFSVNTKLEGDTYTATKDGVISLYAKWTENAADKEPSVTPNPDKEPSVTPNPDKEPTVIPGLEMTPNPDDSVLTPKPLANS